MRTGLLTVIFATMMLAACGGGPGDEPFGTGMGGKADWMDPWDDLPDECDPTCASDQVCLPGAYLATYDDGAGLIGRIYPTNFQCGPKQGLNGICNDPDDCSGSLACKWTKPREALFAVMACLPDESL